MSFVLTPSPHFLPSAGPRRDPDSSPPDEDDGIHIACVTRVERPGGPVLRAVVGWMEDGEWVYRSVEMAETPLEAAQAGPRTSDQSGPTRGRLVDASAFLDPIPLPVAPETDLLLVRLGVRAAAERLGISERTLRRQFDRRGLSLHDHVVARRREMTLGLLAGDLPVATVASRLGFASSQTFARYVRRQFGATATNIRRLMRARNLSVLPLAEGTGSDGAPR